MKKRILPIVAAVLLVALCVFFIANTFEVTDGETPAGLERLGNAELAVGAGGSPAADAALNEPAAGEEQGPFTCLSNAGIPEEVRVAVHVVHDPFIAALKEGDREGVTAALNHLLGGDTPDWLDELMRIGSSSPQIMDEHYLQTASRGIAPQIVAPQPGSESAYTFALTPVNEQMYVIYSTISFPQSTYMLNNVYALVDGAWTLDTCLFTPYQYGGLGSRELLEKAEALLESGYAMPAYIYAEMALATMSPGGNIVYPGQEDMQQALDRVLFAGSDPYGSQVSILYNEQEYILFAFESMATDEEGIVPCIHYITPTSLGDMAVLHNEAAAISAEVAVRYPGMSETFSYFILQAYNGNPALPETQFFAMVVDTTGVTPAVSASI